MEFSTTIDGLAALHKSTKFRLLKRRRCPCCAEHVRRSFSGLNCSKIGSVEHLGATDFASAVDCNDCYVQIGRYFVLAHTHGLNYIFYAERTLSLVVPGNSHFAFSGMGWTVWLLAMFTVWYLDSKLWIAGLVLQKEAEAGRGPLYRGGSNLLRLQSPVAVRVDIRASVLARCL